MITMNEIVKSGFDIGEACKECIHCYGHNNCCEEEEDECSQFDEVRSDYIDFLYSKVTYKQIDDMKHAIGFDNRRVRGTKHRRYEPYRNFFNAGGRDEDWEQLVALGFATKSRENWYRVSDDGRVFLMRVTGVEILPERG